ncbi:MAG: LLM class flavin-dependent oxidoreductase [Salibacteraceae bacterium]|nr:LLM class flavin-dependent oxidoreductase [Salibacteraceae bacterium]
MLKYSILDLATVGEGISTKKTFENVRNLAQHAEEWGYHRFWLAEHHNMKSIASSATSVLIGYLAEGTKTLRIGSGGIMLPNHSPFVIAEQFGTLASLYPGRIDLGLGRAPGTDQVTAQAIRSDRMQSVYSFPEEIKQIRQYLSTSNESSKVRVPFAEGVDLPFYILGSSTDSAYLAAKQGLPYAFASHFAPTLLFDALNIYHNNFEPSAYLDEPYTIGCINTVVADTYEEAEMLSTSSIKLFYGIITGNRDYLKPPKKMNDELRMIQQHPNFQQMRQYSFIGNKAEVQEHIEEFVDSTLVNELMIASHIYDHDARLKSYQLTAEAINGLN